MNKIITSKDEILKNSRELIQQQGWYAVNISSVAAACGVSVGSIYNYFSSKAELVNATIESIWFEIFHKPDDASVFNDTQSCIIWLYGQIEYGYKKYPGFFTLHSLGFMDENKFDGKHRMQQTWQHILDELCSVLKKDMKVRHNAFTDEFTIEKFADMLFSLILSALIRGDYDCTTVLEIIRRTIY